MAKKEEKDSSEDGGVLFLNCQGSSYPRFQIWDGQFSLNKAPV